MKKLFKLIFFVALAFIVIVGGKVTYEGYSLYRKKVDEMPLNEKVESIRGKENYLEYEDIPKTFVSAIVSIEDRRFFDHNGIDILSIFRAVITDLSQKEFAQGGSTITQQLAKNMYYLEENNAARKVAELFTAISLEKNYSKEDILELYSNIVYFGDGYYGLYDAATGYYNKVPKKLSLDEITMLAGLPNAPSVYALSNNSDLSKQRQAQVVDAMLKARIYN